LRGLPEQGFSCYLSRSCRTIKRSVDRAATATLSTKFQLSIPKYVRDEQHWQAVA
jgi:hypothetical protein